MSKNLTKLAYQAVIMSALTGNARKLFNPTGNRYDKNGILDYVRKRKPKYKKGTIKRNKRR